MAYKSIENRKTDMFIEGDF